MKRSFALLSLIAVLVLIATVVGIFYQTPEPRIEHTTVRGEEAVFHGSGLYRYDPVSLAREGIVWDAVNLFLGLPMFAVTIALARRNSVRGQLMLLGMLFYFFYVYLMYATMVAFNQLFLVYVTIFALSSVAFFINLKNIDVFHLAARVSDRFPHRLLIGFTLAVGTLLILLWGKLTISVTVTGQFPTEVAGMTTLETQALDLGMVVPLMYATGYLLWRRSHWGYLLAGISVTFAFLMSVTIPAWIVVPLVEDGKMNMIEAVPFLVLCIVGLYVAIRFYRNVRRES